MFEKELRPTPAALIDEKFMAEILTEAFLPKANGVQRTFGTKDGRIATCGFKQKSKKIQDILKRRIAKDCRRSFGRSPHW